MAVMPGHARIRSENQTMAWLARMLSGQLQGPVIDATGLPAKYDFVVSWAYGENNAASGEPGAMLDPYRPALMRALESQLGLRLVQKKGQGDVLAIDHMEKVPTEN